MRPRKASLDWHHLLTLDYTRDELQALLHDHFPVREFRIEIGRSEFKLHGVGDTNWVLEQMAIEAEAKGREDFDWEPYWAQSWDHPHCVASWLDTFPLRGKQVLDLGCGLGFTGTLLSAAGAIVTFADNAPPSLLFARLNSWPYRDKCNYVCRSWSEAWDSSYDFIVGSDILYDHQQWATLEEFWRRHIRPGGTILLAEPHRSQTDPFPEFAQTRQWTVKSHTHCHDQGDTSTRSFALTRATDAK